MKRKDVAAIARHDKEYGRCSTCKHYQHLITCGECYNGSEYIFDWRKYAKHLINKCNDIGAVKLPPY